MTSAALLTALRTALTPRVLAAGGLLETPASLPEARAFLAAAPRRWRLILLWEGYGSHPAAREGMTTHQISAVIQAPSGLPAAAAAAPKLLAYADLIELVSAWFRALRFPDGTGADSAGFSLDSSTWLEAAPGTQAHQLSFALPAALPPFDVTIPLQF